MDVRPLTAHNYNTALATCRRVVQVVPHSAASPSPVSPVNIIDCIEIRMLLHRQLNMSILCGISNLWMTEVTTDMCRPFDESSHK
jgi:hypothetical protein